MRYWIIKDHKIIKETNEDYQQKQDELKISFKDFGWFVEVEGLGIITSKEYDSLTDPNQNENYLENQKLKMRKLTKHEIMEQNGKAKLKTEKEILEEQKENVIKLKANELSKDSIKMVNGDAKIELENFITKVNKIKKIEEIKNL